MRLLISLLALIPLTSIGVAATRETISIFSLDAAGEMLQNAGDLKPIDGK